MVKAYRSFDKNNNELIVKTVESVGSSLMTTASAISSAQIGANITNGLIDPEMTLVADYDSNKSTLRNIGFINALSFNDLPDNTICFSNGRRIVFSASHEYNAGRIASTYYILDNGYSMSYNTYESATSTINKFPNTVLGLISPSVFDYNVVASTSNTTYHVEAIACPTLRISGNTVYIGNETKGNRGYVTSNYLTPGTYSDGGIMRVSTYRTYPSLPFGFSYGGFTNYSINRTSGPSSDLYFQEANIVDRTAAFDACKSFFYHFWNGITTDPYLVFISGGAGGAITPSNNHFENQNNPVMFTATPDEHHAIHSVTAYNTATNQQIPLQESAMDLLTGAKSYMFTMPAANVRIIVEFRSIEITIPVTVSYTSPRGKVFTTSFNLLYDDTEQRERTAPPAEEQEGENQNE